MSARKMIRCAVYTRKSTEEGLEQEFNSLHAQREACEAYVRSQKAEGWTLIGAHYDDGGFSGGTLERPALQTLLDDIETSKIDVVVVYKIDRLSRSLMDFAKLVEVFDRKSVTFVSVTQSFNTTTSMGRLTLNVLLSFAQFEREVTGERIRDKFAASKKKGMWMGGRIPLGYDLKDRKLLVNAEEAETVRLIFQRYLDLSCVRALKQDLIERGIASKRWTSTTGVTHGGQPFDRGALYCLLRNRLYLGKIPHKGEAYPGEHEAIVPQELFDAVQARLAEGRRRHLGKKSAPSQASLAGILHDDQGVPMTPTYTVKSGRRRYRYYASRPMLGGEHSTASISRVPAIPLEQLVASMLDRIELPAPATASAADTTEAPSPCPVSRIEIKSDTVVILLNRLACLDIWRAADPTGATRGSELIADASLKLKDGETLTASCDLLTLTVPVRARFRGGRAHVINGGNGESAGPDKALIKALARAHRWRQMLETGEVRTLEGLAAKVNVESHHLARTLHLAYLSPAIIRAILGGRQSASLRLAHLLDADIPLSWRQQKNLIEQHAAA